MAWGRLALIHAAEESPEVLEKMATLWGYEAIVPQPTDTDRKSYQSSDQGQSRILADEPAEEKPIRPPALFIVVNKLQQLATTDSAEPEYLSKPENVLLPDKSGSYQFPKAKPLLSMARLIPLLHNSLGQSRRGNNINISCLSAQIAKGKALHRLPYLPRQVWPQRLLIIVDARLDLEPYWVDFIFIVKELKRLLGKEAVTAIRFDEDSLISGQAYCLPYPAAADDEWREWQQPANDEAVLILSDLAARHWRVLFKRLQQHPDQILTLSPSTNRPEDLNLCQTVKPTPLNDKQRLPRYPYQKGFALSALADEKRKEIFALLSTLPLIDAALLRRLRLELNWAGSELEHFIWQHPEVRYNGLGIYFPKEVAKTYQSYYQKETADRFWKIVNEHHAQVFQGLKNLEGLNQYAQGHAVSLDVVKSYYHKLCATLHQAGEQSPQYQALQAQAKTVLGLMSDKVLATDLNEMIHHLGAFAYAKEIEAENWQPLLNQGFDIEKLRWKIPKAQQRLKTWYIVQQRQGQFACIQAESAPLLSIATISGVLPPVYMENGKEQVLAQHSVTLAENETLTIKTDLQQLELKAIKKPGWALSIGRDKEGLFITTTWFGEQHVYWKKPDQNQSGYWTGHKFIGVDNYGYYADVVINGITQRFRWIEPGTFLMGSPETEAGRFEDEVQHLVTLTQGYWLADTTVTQALWQAVMNNNPSHFKDNPNNPVENVSWDDVQVFINQVNALMPNLQVELPTEAQWEYACRAGSTTPFSFGDNITQELVNYSPYTNSEKEAYRKKTVAVKSLPANPWGLYEMHGNVWEWCQDYWGNKLPSEPMTNPIELNSNSKRVMRGGSWDNGTRSVRSAIRDKHDADNHSTNDGFRLALSFLSLRKTLVSSPAQSYLKFYSDDVVILAAANDLNFAETFRVELQKDLSERLGGLDKFRLRLQTNQNDLSQAACIIILLSDNYIQQYGEHFQDFIQLKEKRLLLVEINKTVKPSSLAEVVEYPFWQQVRQTTLTYQSTDSVYQLLMADLVVELEGLLQQLKTQQPYQETDPSKKIAVFINAAPEDRGLAKDIQNRLAQKYHLVSALPATTRTRTDIENKYRYCQAVLFICEGCSEEWIDTQLLTCAQAASEHQKQFKIVAIHTNEEQAKLINVRLPGLNLQYYFCPPETIDDYLPRFVEALK